MATKNIAWNTGSGNINVEYGGSKDGTIIVTSDNNNLYESRSQQIVVKTTDGSNIERTITIQQAAKVRIDISTAIVTASNQTYSGSAKTPTPTVTLNGETIPSSGYDVSYSNNTNAGTATIAITGKDAYTGTATGTFTIAKASRTLSFADSYVVLNTSSNVTKTATPSAGSGDGAITYSISSTTYAAINSSSGNVTSKTSDGSAVVTATIAEGTNYLSASASYNLYVFATTHNYSYSGSVNSATLPPGSYKLQCWGAQGGSNSSDYTYGITSQSGGKGGYSEGVLSVSSPTTVYVFVGGQGSSSGNGGWNCGGGSAGSRENSSGDISRKSTQACGGGATDIALTTSSMTYNSSTKRNDRSSASFLSRMIVAGGGSGGAMGCIRTTSTTTVYNSSLVSGGGFIPSTNKWEFNNYYYGGFVDVSSYRGGTVTITPYSSSRECIYTFLTAKPTTEGQTPSWASGYSSRMSTTSTVTVSVPSNANYLYVYMSSNGTDYRPQSLVFSITTDSTRAQTGYCGGGVTAGGTSEFSGSNTKRAYTEFGYGGTVEGINTYALAAGAGGAGWYGGGRGAANVLPDVSDSGGGSGFVNTSENAQYRPSGYTGLQLDSGTTYAGNISFSSTNGGTETGHSGNGYARITRIS